jgi:hypothetical protein
MTELLKDKNNSRTCKINFCYYFNSEGYPEGKPIDINDRRARRTEKSDYICGDCVDIERKNNSSEFLDHYTHIPSFIDDGDHRVDAWNALTDRVSYFNIMKW